MARTGTATSEGAPAAPPDFRDKHPQSGGPGPATNTEWRQEKKTDKQVLRKGTSHTPLLRKLLEGKLHQEAAHWERR